MSFELIHTSVLRDLDGQSGFGVAAMTRDLPRPLRDALVAWSDGSELDGTTDRAISYAVCHVGGAAWPVLTCVTRCGTDWSGRANRVAHHLVLEATDRCLEGPIALAQAFPFVRDVPEVGLRSAPVLPRLCPPSEAEHGVDPAWVDLLADRLSAPDATTVMVRLPAGLDPMLLLAAVTEHLEPRRRWAVQWSTAASFHAGPGLPSIVMAREQDPQAFDLALPAPRSATSSSMASLVGTPPLRRSAGRGVQTEKPVRSHLEALRFPSLASHHLRPERALPERVASTRVKPWLPVTLFAVAGLIMLVALGLLLW
jgi:hypothetical protein